MTSTYSNRDKKQLLEKINALSSTEHEEIFKILIKNNISFTKNNNGCFFNMSLIPNEIIAEMILFVDYCMINQKEMEEYDKRLNECKLSNNFDALVTGDANASGDRNQSNGKAGVDVAELIAIEKERKANSKNATDVIKMISENQNNEKLQSFVRVMSDSADRIHKKKMNSKYMNARKSFARRCADRKFDFEGGNNLSIEPY
jgi:hypothetical protein